MLNKEEVGAVLRFREEEVGNLKFPEVRPAEKDPFGNIYVPAPLELLFLGQFHLAVEGEEVGPELRERVGWGIILAILQDDLSRLNCLVHFEIVAALCSLLPLPWFLLSRELNLKNCVLYLRALAIDVGIVEGIA